MLFSPFFLSAQISESCFISHPSNDRYGSYSPSGDKILFESDRSGHWSIYIWERETETVSPLFSDTISRRRPSWSPSGQKIIFEVYQSKNKNSLVEYDLNSQNTQILVEGESVSGEILFAHYAPDGRQIAFTLMESPQISNIAILDLATGIWKKVTDLPFRTTYANWSPDAKSLLLFSRKETENRDDEIYIYKLKSKKWKRLTNWPKHNFCPKFSPSGKQIAYVTSMEGSRPEIYVMKKNGKAQTRLTFNENGETLPNWSPDGKRLLITAYRGDNYEICEIELE